MNGIEAIKKNRILVIAFVAYLLVFIYDGALFSEAIETSWIYIREMLEVLPPVLIFTGLLEVWVPRETILKTFGSGSGLKGKVASFFLGSASAGPIYAGFPITQSLLKKGASVTNITIILSAWSVTKIPILLIEFQFLGAAFMAARWAVTLPAIIAIGYITGKLVSKDEIIESMSAGKGKIGKILEILPGHNCGSCGHKNCIKYAEALAEGDADPDLCKPGGEKVEKEIKKILNG